jgi:hypothetical protein
MKIKEFIIVAAVTVAVLFINNLPLLSGYLNKKYNLQFLGRRFVNSQDVYTYVSFIEQAKQGKVLFENLYTTDPQQPALLRPSYFFIGKFAHLTGLSSIAAYHLSRIVLTILFIFTLYGFLGLFFKKNRIAALIFALVSSGLGFLFGSLFKNSIDLWVPEAITFMSLAEAPHFILAQLLMVLIFWNFLKKRYFLAGLLLFMLSLEHPFNLFPIFVTLVILLLWERKFSFSMVWMILFSAAGLGYQLFELATNPVLRSWSTQNILLSPDPVSYIVGFGLLIPLAFIGGENFLKEQSQERKLIIAWFSASFVLPFFPVAFQRRFIEGIHLPLAILAVEGSILLAKKHSKLSETIFIGVIIFFVSFSSLGLIIKDIQEINKDSSSNYYYHLLTGEVAAMQWLKENSRLTDGILSNWFYGNIIPGIAGRRVYLGHKIQTPDFDKRVENINKFILDTNNQEAKKFLDDNHINYVFLGNNDSIIYYGFKPKEKPYLNEVYNQEGISIYQIR